MMPKRLFLLNVVLVTAAAVFSVQIIRTLLTSPQLPTAPPLAARQVERPPAEEPPRAASPLATYDVVAARNLFSPNRSETVTAAVSSVGKPLLYGIVFKDGVPVAFLEDPVTRRVAEYKLGDQVAGGRLERIEADRIVIRRGQEQLEVFLRDPAKPKSATTAQPGVPTFQPPMLAPSPQVQTPPPPPAPQPIAPNIFRRPQAPATPR